jgi:hypothetical protein
MTMCRAEAEHITGLSQLERVRDSSFVNQRAQFWVIDGIMGT